MLVLALTLFSPLIITLAFIVYIWTRFQRAPACRSDVSKVTSLQAGTRTMAEVMEILDSIPFRASVPGPISTMLSTLIDLVPSALAKTRVTAGIVYPYPSTFEPIVLESHDGTPICGHLALQSDATRRPAVILASGSRVSKNSHWLLSLALEAYHDWGFHVMAVDLRNRGDSGRCSEAPSSLGYRESDDIMAAAEYLESFGIVSTVGVCGEGMAAAAALLAAGRSKLNRPLGGGVVAIGAYAEAGSEVERLSGPGAFSLLSSARRLLARALWLFRILAGMPEASLDLREYIREVPCQYYEIEEADLYRKASPARIMSEMKIPCLLLHAEDDLMSPVENARALLDAADENPMVAAMIVPCGGHALYGPATGKWFRLALETFFTYWGEYGSQTDGIFELAGIEGIEIFGNPDN